MQSLFNMLSCMFVIWLLTANLFLIRSWEFEFDIEEIRMCIPKFESIWWYLGRGNLEMASTEYQLKSKFKWSSLNSQIAFDRKLSIYSIFAVLVAFILNVKFVCWNAWSGDTYPILHGGYISNWYGEGTTEKYEYWHLENINLVDMNVYSSGDVLLTYLSYIQNNPLLSMNLQLSINSLVKIDGSTGKTIWAKEIIDYSSK